MAHYYAYKFGLNRLRIDGDIRQNRYNGQIGNCLGRYDTIKGKNSYFTVSHFAKMNFLNHRAV